jgi:Spy/CpxP family protein refolding chaperone
MKKIDVNMKVLIAVVALFGLSLSLMAQPPQRQHEFHKRDYVGIAMMDLTEAQKADVKEIQIARMKEVQPLKDELNINRAKLNALVNKDNPDMKKIVSLAEANGKIMTNIHIKQIESKIRVRALLTDEQKVIYDAHEGQPGRRMAIAEQRMDFKGHINHRTPAKYRF